MNFIIKLSKSKNSFINVKYDLILVIIDRLIKQSHLISFRKKYTIKQLSFVVLNRLIRYHEILKKEQMTKTNCSFQIIKKFS